MLLTLNQLAEFWGSLQSIQLLNSLGFLPFRIFFCCLESHELKKFDFSISSFSNSISAFSFTCFFFASSVDISKLDLCFKPQYFQTVTRNCFSSSETLSAKRKW